jgi:hypothetical protein
VTVEPPPPGGSWGFTYRFVPAEGACWSGEKGREWRHGARPLDLVMGVVVLGVGTEAVPAEATSFLEGLVDQLSAEHSEPHLVSLAQPAAPRLVDEAVTSRDADPWQLPALREAPGVPCARVDVSATLRSSDGELQLHDVQGRCDGQVGVSFVPGELRRHYLRVAGLDPFHDTLSLQGEVTLRARPEALSAAIGSLDRLDDAERALPLWRAAADAVDPGAQGASLVRPWEHRIEVRRLEVTGLDRRPWLLVSLVASLVGLLCGLGTAAGLRQVHAARAMRATYEDAARSDPMNQRPLSTILAEAQQQVAKGWVIRAGAGTLVGAGAWLVSFFVLMTAYRMFLG